ncbi:MAG TPA: branched-chain amino acid ABC transporter permease [Ilumatobacteraceae bacterium]|nr:branched-chain amino acid ABC transporter permease [Ilumatobacteraceae bacterium]
MKPWLTLREGGGSYWAIRATVAVLVLAVVLYIPMRAEAGTISTAVEALVLMGAAMALNLVLGYTGQISIGHSAFLGIGAYVTGIFVSRWGWSPWVTLPVAFVIAFLIGVVVSFPASRIKGVYLALVTLALGLVFPQILLWPKLTWLTGGGPGLPNDESQVPSTGFNIGRREGQMQFFKIFGWDPFGDLRRPDAKEAFFYWIALVFTVIVYLVCRGIVKSRVGRSLVAIRDNETAAAVMGVNLVRTKAFVFGISAGLCALPGCLTAMRSGTISPEGIVSLTVRAAITFLIVMVIGGAGSLWGPIVGAVAYTWIIDKTGGWAEESAIPAPLRPLFGWADIPPADGIFALLLILLMFVAPRGLVGAWKQYSPRIVRVIPRPAGAIGATPAVVPATVTTTPATAES